MSLTFENAGSMVTLGELIDAYQIRQLYRHSSCVMITQNKIVGTYSHLSNKRGGKLIDFEKKFHPPRTFPPSTFIDFLDFFHPRLLVY